MIRKLTTLTSFLTFLLFYWLIPVNTFALTISPIRYEVSGDPGQVLEEKMTLVNETKETQIYYASFANFEAQGDSGSPSFVEPKDDLGTWITTDQASISLLPGQQKIVSFKVTIPQDAEPGGHFAAIFWGNSPGTKAGEVSVGTKTGLLILLTVRGDIKESAGLLDFQLHNKKWFYTRLPVGFQYRFSNQGGDRVKPEGSVVIRSLFGWTVKKVNANPVDGNVLPGTTRKFMPEWSKRDSVDIKDQEGAKNQKYSFIGEVKNQWDNFAVGIFRAKVEATFGSSSQNIKSPNIYFVVFPPELFLLVSLVGGLLYFILREFIKKYNASIIKKAKEQDIKDQG